MSFASSISKVILNIFKTKNLRREYSRASIQVSMWASKTVADLKKECKERGLKVSGTKAELVER